MGTGVAQLAAREMLVQKRHRRRFELCHLLRIPALMAGAAEPLLVHGQDPLAQRSTPAPLPGVDQPGHLHFPCLCLPTFRQQGRNRFLQVVLTGLSDLILDHLFPFWPGQKHFVQIGGARSSTTSSTLNLRIPRCRVGKFRPGRLHWAPSDVLHGRAQKACSRRSLPPDPFPPLSPTSCCAAALPEAAA